MAELFSPPNVCCCGAFQHMLGAHAPMRAHHVAAACFNCVARSTPALSCKLSCGPALVPTVAAPAAATAAATCVAWVHVPQVRLLPVSGGAAFGKGVQAHAMPLSIGARSSKSAAVTAGAQQQRRQQSSRTASITAEASTASAASTATSTATASLETPDGSSWARLQLAALAAAAGLCQQHQADISLHHQHCSG
jgi:hypothetical protein